MRAKKMLTKYADEIGATFEYMNKHKDGFLIKDCKSLINQMCFETTRSLRKGNVEDPTINETTVILDDSNDETRRPKRKLSVEDDDDAGEFDFAESNKIKKSIYGDENIKHPVLQSHTTDTKLL
jgi:hypothetical protein